jgi:hypothetical protein
LHQLKSRRGTLAIAVVTGGLVAATLTLATSAFAGGAMPAPGPAANFGKMGGLNASSTHNAIRAVPNSFPQTLQTQGNANQIGIRPAGMVKPDLRLCGGLLRWVAECHLHWKAQRDRAREAATRPPLDPPGPKATRDPHSYYPNRMEPYFSP